MSALPQTSFEDTPESRARRLRELRIEREQAETERRDLEGRRWAMLDRPDDERRVAAIALINGGPVEIDGLDARLERLRMRIEVIDDALRILRPLVTEDARRDAAAATRELRPAHRKAVLDLARALVAVSKANEEVAAIGAQASGLAPLTAATFPGIGTPRGESPLAYWLRYIERNGLISADEVKQLRREFDA